MGSPIGPERSLRQPLLAATLRRIAEQGRSGFYQGPVAEKLEALMQQRGGLIDRQDLAAYRAPWVEPVQGTLPRPDGAVDAAPSSGGVTLIQMLNLLEPMGLEAMGLNSAESIHTLVEAMNLAYRDRNSELGDPDQVAVPVQRLTNKRYADALRPLIRPKQHTPSAALGGTAPLPANSTNTTHLSVADQQGSLVALTTTLNFAYGNGVAIPGTGVLLNNEMDDFTRQARVPNAYGLVQGEKNAIAPGRRPLSSMTPTVVLKRDGSPWLATGTPGAAASSPRCCRCC